MSEHNDEVTFHS